MQIFDEKKKRIGTLSGYKELAITTSLDTGDKELTFRYPSNGTYAEQLKEEAYIRTKEDEFVIKGVEKGEQFNNYTAVLNVEELEGKVFPQGFESKEKTIKECLEAAFDGTVWSIRASTVSKKRTIREQEETTAWSVLKRSLSTYRCECIIDSLKKEIEIHEVIGTDKGCYFIEGLNIRKVEQKSDTYDFFTRIYPIGRDGLTPESVLGKPYIDNFQYSNKIKATVWKDERYTKVESLIEDANAKLEEMSKPYKEFTVEVADLAKTSEEYKDILSYKIGDTVTIVSKKTKTREKHRIVKLTEYPKTPEKNTVEIANLKKTFAEVQQEEIEAETIRATAEEEKLGEGIEQNTEDIEELNENLGDINIRLEKTDEGLLAEVTRAQGAENTLSGRIELSAEQINMEIARAMGAESEMSARIRASAHSIDLSASGGDNSVGITIQLYDENGNLIDTSAGNANINIVGFATFSDLAGNGTTTINGSNITTGIISADMIDTENLVAKNGNFTKSFNVEIPISGSKNFVIRAESDELCCIGREVYNSGLGGNVLYGIYFKGNKAYYSGNSGYGEIATKNDIPSTSSFALASYGTLSNPTLTGNIDAIGIKGRSSSATANVRCQDSSSHGYLAISAESSMRYKHDIADISDDKLNPERLYDLPIRQFVYNLDYLDVNDQRYGETVCGFIAEEIANVYPVACEYNADGVPENWDIRYVIPPMLALIQEQHKDIDALQMQMISLQMELDFFKTKNGGHEKCLVM